MDIAKLAGVDAVKLVVMIVRAAQTVRRNKKTCRQLVHHVQIIGDLLEKLQTPAMMQHPETRNGLNDLEEILREVYMFVTSCQNNKYLYHLFTGKKQADQLRILQKRMNSCLQVFPLISHIDTIDRLDKILEIIQPPRSQAVKDVPRLLTGCSSCDTRYGQLNRKKVIRNYIDAFKFSLSQLVGATNNFSDRNLIGKGSFGCIYKGQLHDGLEIAVKRCFDLSSSPNLLDVQDYQFQNEIRSLPNLQHTNIIKLLGDCVQGREKILVYEYMSNGSLDSFIRGMCARRRRLHLDWPTHFQIIKGIAEGLLYLHKLSGLHIIHGDLKPSNILLDTNMKPKISDFGLSRTYSPGVVALLLPNVGKEMQEVVLMLSCRILALPTPQHPAYLSIE
ncbi:G-type lectin S-receptor-like serine/threonine-protein kinase [Zea mays]|uniref:non-specific serine/threonine protein kinase n=1 Tax=Zea mays TaxID=4577 RepID=A0A3L6FVT5_MAIZE|nr:G-type lectin S-receptor-like serine/threonine-protein kinase [Zea mays]